MGWDTTLLKLGTRIRRCCAPSTRFARTARETEKRPGKSGAFRAEAHVWTRALVGLLLVGAAFATSHAQLVGGNAYPISGISSPPTSFASISDAVSYAKANGVTGTGQIVLELSSGYAGEPAPVTIPVITGLSSTLGLTIRPTLGYTALTAVAGTSGSHYAIDLQGGYVTLDGRSGGVGTGQNWTIRCTGSGTGGYGESAVRFDNSLNAMSNLAVRYCILEAEAANTTSGILGVTGAGNLLTSVTLEQNLIRSTGSGATNCRGVGIDISGISNTSNSGLALRGNVINQIYYAGINLTGACPGAEISGNEIAHTAPVTQASANAFSGIYFQTQNMAGASIFNNFIHDLQLTTGSSWVAGILLYNGNSSGNHVRLFNNRVDLGAGIQPTTVPIFGIYTAGGGNGLFDLDYNSVYVGGTPTSGSANSVAFGRYDGGYFTLNVRDNVFFNARSNGGTASGTNWGIALNSTSALTTLNNNDYFANGAGGVLGTNNGGTSGNRYTMAQWQAVVPMDTKSVSQDPHYQNPTTTPPDLTINATIPTQLESGGTAISGIDTDFQGDIRQGSAGYNGTGTAPDIGADEFEGIPVNLNPLVGGINYPINGTQNPPTSFASITGAVSYLNVNGVTGSGQVLLELSPGYLGESAPVMIPVIAGASSTVGVTIRPATGYTALTAVSGTGGNRYAILISGSYVTLEGEAGGTSGTRDWTIRCTGSGTSGYGESAVRFDNTSNTMTNLAVRYCVLEAEAANGTNAILEVTGTGTYTLSNLTLENDLIRSTGSDGTHCRGYGIDFSGATNGGNGGLIIRNNVVNQVAYGGINLTASSEGAQVYGNEISHTVPVTQPSANTFWGIEFNSQTMAGTAIYSNFIHDLQLTNGSSWVAGIYLYNGNQSGSRIRVYNNRVDLGAGIQSTAVALYGIYAYAYYTYAPFDIDYNSVYIGGSPATGSGNSAAFFESYSNNVYSPYYSVRNNVFFNGRSNSGSATGTHWGISIQSTSYFTTLNYNDYYANGAGGVLGTTDGSTSGNKPTLACWQAIVTMDTQSVTQDPHYRNATATPPDLTVDPSIPTQLESGGVAIAGIDTDFQGDIRWGSQGYQGTGTAPDIGADEFEGTHFYLTPLVGGTTHPINGVDSPPTSFATLTSAVNYLNVNRASGSGQIILELSPGYSGEPGPLWIPVIGGLNAGLGLTIRPATGFTAMTSVAGTNDSRSAIRLTGSYVALEGQAGGVSGTQDWTIRCTGPGAGGFGESAVRLDGGSNPITNDAVRFCVLEGEAANQSSAILAVTGTPAYMVSNLTLERDLIQSTGSDASNCRGTGVSVASASNGGNTGLVVRDNLINAFAHTGVHLGDASFQAAAVYGNEICHLVPVTQPAAGPFAGIDFESTQMAGAQVYDNFIHDIQLINASGSVSGVYLGPGNGSGDRVRIYNNRVDLGSGIQPTDVPIYGICASPNGYSGLFDIQYNSVYLGGTPASGSANSAAFCKGSSNYSFDIRNNIFMNARSNSGSASGTHWGISTDGIGGLLRLNYNDYYVNGSGGVLATRRRPGSC